MDSRRLTIAKALRYRPFVRLCVAALCLSFFNLPGVGAALTIDRAIIRVNPTRSDSVRLTGRLEGLTIDQASSVRIALDGVGYTVPLAQLQRKGKRRTYRGKAPGLRTLIVRSNGTFTASWRDVVLGSIQSPLQVEVNAGTAGACAHVRLAERGKPKPAKPGRPPHPRRWVAAAAGSVRSICGLAPPSFTPAARIVGEPGDVVVEAIIAGTPSPGTVQLVPADITGLPSGPPRCTLVDDGSPGAGDAVAGDGRYACRLTIDTSAASRVALMVTATLDGAPSGSAPVDLRVVPPLGSTQVAEMFRVLEVAKRLWADAKAKDGDSLAARWATLRGLRLDPAVESVTLAEEDGSIAFRYVAGPLGSLGLTPRENAAATTPSSAVPGTVLASRAAAEEDEARQVVGNRKVFVWDPGYFFHHEGRAVREQFEASTCPRFDVTLVEDRAATVASLADLMEYGTVVIITHGVTQKTHGRYDNCFLTSVANTVDALEFVHLLLHEDLGLNVTEHQVGAFCVHPAFIRALPGSFPSAIIWGGFCFSAMTDATSGRSGSGAVDDPWVSVPGPALNALANAFQAKGAGAYFGFPRKIEDDWAFERNTQDVLPGLIARGRDTRTVWNAIEPKVNVYSSYSTYYAVPLLLLPDDARLAYTKATIVPKTLAVASGATRPLRIDLEGVDDCTLVYRWRNTGQAGHLIGGDDQEIDRPQIAYQADSGVGSDIVTVDVVDVAGAPSRVLFTRTATVAVGCAACVATGLAPQLLGRDAGTCATTEQCCQDGMDNDHDGQTDCDDTDCATDDPCRCSPWEEPCGAACCSTTQHCEEGACVANPTTCVGGASELSIRGERCCPTGSGNSYSCGHFKCDYALFQSGPGGCDVWCSRPDEGGQCSQDTPGLPVPGAPGQKCCCGSRPGAACVWP